MTERRLIDSAEGGVGYAIQVFQEVLDSAWGIALASGLRRCHGGDALVMTADEDLCESGSLLLNEYIVRLTILVAPTSVWHS